MDRCIERSNKFWLRCGRPWRSLRRVRGSYRRPESVSLSLSTGCSRARRRRPRAGSAGTTARWHSRGGRVRGVFLELETYLEPSAPVSPEPRRIRLPGWAAVSEGAVLALFAAFFIFYGVTPWLGGD